MTLGPEDFARRIRRDSPTSAEAISTGRAGAILARWPGGLRAVVKISRDRLRDGKTEQKGIPVSSHPKREVAFFRLAKAFGCDDIVPTTVPFEFCGREASAQEFIPCHHLDEFDADLKEEDGPAWVKALCSVGSYAPRSSWLRLALLDFVAGSRDRHANNVGLAGRLRGGEKGSCRLVAFDNAASFGLTFERYHEVFHKFFFREKIKLDGIWDRFSSVSEKQIEKALYGLLTAEEIRHACLRYQFALKFPYRLPWKKISCGEDRPRDFPAREDFFRDPNREPKLYVAA